MAQGPLLTDGVALQRVSREVVAQCLDVTVRNLHALVERGILPAPVEHGVYDLPACLDAYLVHRAKIPVPTSWIEAELAVDMALRAKRVYLRRAGVSESEIDAARP